MARIRARGAGRSRIERAEQVGGELLVGQGRFGVRGDERSRRLEVALADVDDEHGEERSGVARRQALAAIDPQQVRVPVVVAARSVDEDDVTPAEEIDQASGAAEEHVPDGIETGICYSAR